MKEIITDVEKLSEFCDNIDIRKENDLLREIILELKKVIREKNLVSLSAPQLGYNKRVFCMRFGKDDIRTYVNPIIASVKGLELSRESCTSIPGKTYLRIRQNDIQVMYMDPLGRPQQGKLIGMAAIVFQHEVDHLDGLLLSDIGLEIDDDFDAATKEEKEQIIDMYLDSLDIKRKSINAAVESDPASKKISDAIDFMNSVNEGTTKLTNAQFDGIAEK